MNHEIESYEILCAPDPTVLEELVSNRLKLGWTPQGGPIIHEFNQVDSVRIYQAMVKTKPFIQ